MPSWMEPLSELRAKGDGESLVAHTHQVLIALRHEATLRPRLAELACAPRLWHWAFWACFLHDLGKAAIGFQRMLEAGKPWSVRHELLSLAFVQIMLQHSAPEDLSWIAAGVAFHHKELLALDRLYPRREPWTENAAWQDGPTDAALTAIWAWAAETGRERIVALGFDAYGVQRITLPPLDPATFRTHLPHLAQAALEQARRLLPGSGKAGHFLRGLILRADHAASAGAPPPNAPPLTTPPASDWWPLQPRSHQIACSQRAGSVLVLGPTGSGKTECALAWARQQQRLGDAAPRLFYVLPFQASINSMYHRLQAHFPGQVGMQHGDSLHLLYHDAMEGGDHPAAAAGHAKRLRDLTRLGHFAIRVLTPYQLLQAAYRLKGYEPVLMDLAGSLIVVDEIHAYAPALVAQLVELLGWLRRELGCSLCILSATLPAILANALQETVGPLQVIASAEEPPLRHRLVVRDGDLLAPGVVDEVAERARQEAVLVCCSTVGRAQEAFDRLSGRLQVPVHLLHSRFTARDRRVQEAALLRMAGGVGPHPPGLAIATQAVEVSLNLSFSTLYTDPAPLEALVQRFGRVNRFAEQAVLADVHVFREPVDAVYDPALVKRALEFLHAVDGAPLAEGQITAWMQQLYAGDLGTAWQMAYAKSAKSFQGGCLQTLRPFAVSDPVIREAFYRSFDNVDVLPASLADEYEQAWAERPLDAAELLVGIPYGIYSRLQAAGRLRRRAGWPPIADVPYDPQRGLK